MVDAWAEGLTHVRADKEPGSSFQTDPERKLFTFDTELDAKYI